jgi:hypothetical protein
VTYKYTSEGYSEGKISANGLRDYDYRLQKGDGVFRILCLGDSFIEGLQVPLDSTISKLLERELNGSCNAETYEVINCGRGGMGTADEFLWYLQEGAKFNPDLVILGIYYGNDFRNNSRKLSSPSGTIYQPFVTVEADSYAVDYSFRESRSFKLKSLLFPIVRRSVLLSELVRMAIIFRLRGNREKMVAASVIPNPDLFVYAENAPAGWEKAYAITGDLIVLFHGKEKRSVLSF